MSIKQTFTNSSFALTLIATPCLAETQTVGVMNFTYDAAHRERLVQTTLFYPSASGGYLEWIGDNLVFKGVQIQRDAKPEPGKHPLIIVSHGSGGNAANLGWLAQRLAAQGFVVAIPNHQGSTSADSTPETTIPAVWERPADISKLIDALTASASISTIVDFNDISALGFSLGGLTALSLAGAQVNADKLAQYCDNDPAAMSCEWFDKGNPLIPGHVDLHTIDKHRFEANFREPRISRIVAIDPAFAPTYDPASLEEISSQVQIINLGVGNPLSAMVKADHIAANIKDARYDTIAGANHFDFLGQCKRLGWFFIWMEGDDPVCSKTADRSRAALHEEIAAKVLDFLKPNQM
jgi:predicted dienelactone hydrolase